MARELDESGAESQREWGKFLDISAKGVALKARLYKHRRTGGRGGDEDEGRLRGNRTDETGEGNAVGSVGRGDETGGRGLAFEEASQRLDERERERSHVSGSQPAPAERSSSGSRSAKKSSEVAPDQRISLCAQDFIVSYQAPGQRRRKVSRSSRVDKP